MDFVSDSRVPVKDRLTILTDILTNPQLSVHCFAAKEAHKTLYKCCKITATCRFYDPNVADWLLNSETSEKSYHCLVSTNYKNLYNNYIPFYPVIPFSDFRALP